MDIKIKVKREDAVGVSSIFAQNAQVQARVVAPISSRRPSIAAAVWKTHLWKSGNQAFHQHHPSPSFFYCYKFSFSLFFRINLCSWCQSRKNAKDFPRGGGSIFLFFYDPHHKIKKKDVFRPFPENTTKKWEWRQRAGGGWCGGGEGKESEGNKKNMEISWLETVPVTLTYELFLFF